MQGKLEKLFLAHFGYEPLGLIALRAHASERKIYRLTSKEGTLIGVVNPNVSENRAFIAFSRHFRKYGLPVPEIYAIDFSEVVYLEEDLGNLTLYDFLLNSRTPSEPFPAAVEEVYREVARILPRFQMEAGATLDFSLCHQSARYDRRAMLDDMYYFRDSFLKRTSARFEANRLEDMFRALADFLAQADADYFLYRDFQARNIMVQHCKPYFIDYQAGRKGALQWDIASLLYQSQARIPAEARDRLFEEYFQAVQKYRSCPREAFLNFYHGFVLVRLMQVLATYGRVGLGEGKEYFLKGIPIALGNLSELARNAALPLDLGPLTEVLASVKEQCSFK